MEFLLHKNQILISYKIKNETISMLSAYIEDNIINIVSLKTNEKYYNKGYASKLLEYIINYAKNNNYSKIILDDVSDMFMKKNNIYIKHNFTYIKDGLPEMVLKV